MATATQTPAPRSTRLPALDVLRGLAILGTLLTNIWLFSLPRGLGETLPGGPGDLVPRPMWSWEYVGSAALTLVTDGKWIGLLTIMFGIGLEIQRQSALRRGERWPGTYPWRAILLIVEGALNYLFIFEFDVLMGYGLTALVVAAVLARSPRAQMRWLVGGLTVHVLLMALLSVAFGWALREIPAEELIAEGVDSSSYWAMVLDRAQNVLLGRAEIPIMVLMGIGLFLLGAALYRAGIFLPEGAVIRRRVALIGLGVGVPLDVLSRTVWVEWTLMFGRYVTSSIVALGVLAVVAAFYARRERTGALGTGLSWVGRTALTCYLLQNLICSIIFYDYGFGLAGHLTDATRTPVTLAVYAGVALALVLGASLWLRVFARGPVEIVMHRAHAALSTRSRRRRDQRLAAATS
ncbi:MAG: DUF418 domain-containing protein [Mobilicoccus sp.]|nr:DUF418 domain-containing protein [Mobilicoccus sp.]